MADAERTCIVGTGLAPVLGVEPGGLLPLSSFDALLIFSLHLHENGILLLRLSG
jgi:hypothetical protein